MVPLAALKTWKLRDFSAFHSFVACWKLAFFGWVFFFVFFFVVAVWAVGAWQGFEALDQDSVTLGALGCEIFGQREEGKLTLNC